MDWALRAKLKTMNSVAFLGNCDVVGLLTDASCQRVTGVQMRVRTPSLPSPGETTEVRTALVVDASGRTSQAPRWLEALGYCAPKEVIVNADHGYSSRFYRIFPDAKRDWRALYVQPAPPTDVRGGLIFPVEGNRWLVSLWGGAKDYPPNDDAGFLKFARSLRTPLLYETICQAEPLTAISSFRSTANRLRQFDRLPRQPENFVVLGDAACAFNPVYGQGMTTAAIEAVLLDALLARYRKTGDLTGLAPEFQRRLARANSTPWMLATGEDLRYSKTGVGQSPWVTRAMRWYLDRILQTSLGDIKVRQVFLETMHMLKPLTALFHPRMVIRALRNRPPRFRRSVSPASILAGTIGEA
jgi:2-polyprenyl-6-methoxyphenol hydroxylase-like FAD-dependent oxidoreductase